MKVAIIGGNLLGCATTLNLALVQEHDQRKFSQTTQFAVKLFQRQSGLGAQSFSSVRIDDTLHVETGAYKTLPVIPGTYLADLVSAANGGRGTISIFSSKIRIPGSIALRRGSPNAAPVVQPWNMGSYKRIIRSFAAWDWRDDQYHLIHSGWPLLDIMCRILNNQIWRSVALSFLIYTIQELRKLPNPLSRAIALLQVAIAVVLLVLSPRGVVTLWQRQYSFWATTISLLVSYGITPGISRGSTIGFVKHLSDMNIKNVATCSISAGKLASRAGLDAYLRGTGEDYVRMFKYDRVFVDRFIAPVVGIQYGGEKLSQVNSFAAHFAMLDADFANSDINTRLCTISPDNATLCTALVNAARDTMDVEVCLNSAVTKIIYSDTTLKYTITYGDNESEEFDGVILCESLKDEDIEIDSARGSSVAELLGYERDKVAVEQSEQQEIQFLAEQAEGSMAIPDERGIAPGSCSHFAVVVGCAKASFFRFSTERQIPDLIQVTYAMNLSRFERIREPSDDQRGVYTVTCGEDFESCGLFNEMFESGAELVHFAARQKGMYSHTAIPEGMVIDECMPYIVLGNRFVYAAATDRLAKHPEMDAVSAVNAASLFSQAVQWSTAEDAEEEEEEQPDEEDD